MKLDRNFRAVMTFAAFMLAGAYSPRAAADERGFPAWRAGAVREAVEEGITPSVARAVLGEAEYLPRVIELDRKQPDGSMTYAEYLKRVLPASRIEAGRKRLKEHDALLSRMEKRYGVQKRFIVALWGSESDFGRNMGGFRVVDALATLAYEGRRGEFFKGELFKALKILDQGHITSAKMTGSWAGAMGQCQFMPSSFLRLSADGNGDGKRDIWTNKADVFASIANYLHTEGWNPEMTWGREVTLSRPLPEELTDGKTLKSVQEWNALGVRRKDGSPLPPWVSFRAGLVRPDKEGGRAFLTYDNYRILMKWNRSSYFGTSVGLFADSLR